MESWDNMQIGHDDDLTLRMYHSDGKYDGLGRKSEYHYSSFDEPLSWSDSHSAAATMPEEVEDSGTARDCSYLETSSRSTSSELHSYESDPCP